MNSQVTMSVYNGFVAKTLNRFGWNLHMFIVDEMRKDIGSYLPR